MSLGKQHLLGKVVYHLSAGGKTHWLVFFKNNLSWGTLSSGRIETCFGEAFAHREVGAVMKWVIPINREKHENCKRHSQSRLPERALFFLNILNIVTCKYRFR